MTKLNFLLRFIQVESHQTQKNVHFLFEVAKKELKVTFGKQTVYIRHHQKKNPYI